MPRARWAMKAVGAILVAVFVAAADRGCTGERAPERVVLRVANWGSPAVVDRFMELEREFKQEFEQQHPGVRIQFEQIPGFGQYAPKLLMMHATGSMPDVISLDIASGAAFMDNGVLRDLAPLVQRDLAFRLDNYFPRVVDMFRRGDRLYSIPFDFTPMMLFYNKKLFDQAGVPYPKPDWSWSDFLRIAQQLTVPDPNPAKRQYGLYLMNVMPFWLPMLWANAGDVLGPVRPHSDGAASPVGPDGWRSAGYFDAPNAVQAVQFLIDLMLKYHVAPTLEESKASGVDMFRTGQAAMDIKGHWMMIEYRTDKLDFGVVPLPTTTGRPTTVVYATGLSLTAKAVHPELGWEYIKFMTSKEIQIRRVSTGLAISGNRQAAAHYAGTRVEDAFIAAAEYARPPWGATVERYPFIEGLGEEMLEDLIASRGSLDTAAQLHKTSQLIDSALKEP